MKQPPFETVDELREALAGFPGSARLEFDIHGQPGRVLALVAVAGAAGAATLRLRPAEAAHPDDDPESTVYEVYGYATEADFDDCRFVPIETNVLWRDDAERVAKANLAHFAVVKVQSDDREYIDVFRRTDADRVFDVDIVRTGYGRLTLRVTGAYPEQAEAVALNNAGNHSFSEHTSEYDADGVTEVNDE